MNPTFAALFLGLVLADGPSLAFGTDLNTITPSITFPEPAPQPVTKGAANPSKQDRCRGRPGAARRAHGHACGSASPPSKLVRSGRGAHDGTGRGNPPGTQVRPGA